MPNPGIHLACRTRSSRTFVLSRPQALAWWLLAACGREPDDQSASDGSSEDSNSTEQDSGSAADADATADEGTSSDPTSVTVTASDDGMTTDPTADPTGEPTGTCTPWEDNCLEGEKCTRSASIPAGYPDQTVCVPIQPNPKQAGEGCFIQGEISSGIDDCDKGLYCFGWDWATNTGYCAEVCAGPPDSPSCTTEGTVCDVQTPELNICIATCDPLALVCPGAVDMCEQSNYSDYWICWPEYDPLPGQIHGVPCPFNNACDPGFTCAAGDLVEAPDCNAGNACCTDVCDLDAPAPCPGANETCKPYPYYPSGTPAKGYENIGMCSL